RAFASVCDPHCRQARPRGAGAEKPHHAHACRTGSGRQRTAGTLRMRIAVTGAGGFIGSALTQMLAGEGHEVLPLSRNDLSDPDFSGVETLVHCAALAHRTGAERPDAATFNAVNHRLAVELAAKAKAAGVRRFVFVSTIYTIAGNPSPLTPDMPLNPRDDYGRAKAKAEADLLALSG